MRGISLAILAGLLIAGAAPIAANTFIVEYEYTDYHYVYTPNPHATWYVYSEADPENVIELGRRDSSPSMYIWMGLPGVYPSYLAGSTVNFTDMEDERDEWITELDVPGKDTGAPHYIYGGTFDPSDSEYSGTAITGGYVEFDHDMNIASWQIQTGFYDYFFASGSIGTDGSEFFNDYSPTTGLYEELFGEPPDSPESTLLWYYSDLGGTWERTRYAAYDFYMLDYLDQCCEPEILSTFIPRNTGGGINPNPGDLGGGGGLPGPVPLPPSPVPLPASVLLLFSGLGALGAGGLWRRRRALG